MVLVLEIKCKDGWVGIMPGLLATAPDKKAFIEREAALCGGEPDYTQCRLVWMEMTDGQNHKHR